MLFRSAALRLKGLAIPFSAIWVVKSGAAWPCGKSAGAADGIAMLAVRASARATYCFMIFSFFGRTVSLTGNGSIGGIARRSLEHGGVTRPSWRTRGLTARGGTAFDGIDQGVALPFNFISAEPSARFAFSLKGFPDYRRDRKSVV